MLNPRPFQCFRCWGFGHSINTCNSARDRRGNCFRCGDTGHKLDTCNRPIRCIVCAEVGRSSDHRCGSDLCRKIQEEEGVPVRRTDLPVSRND